MLKFTPVERWEKLPREYHWEEVVGIATDSRDRVFVFARGRHPLLVFERDGTFVTTWGEGVFKRPHGITIGPDDAVYLSDDHGHQVSKFTPEGKVLLTLGTGEPSDTGVEGMDYRTIRRAAGPFHYPTNLGLSDDGMMYVTDGYGNSRVHKFSAKGELLLSWGEPGAGPGQFHLPHGIAIDTQGIVYVADRENSRVQLFSQDGKYLSEWTDVVRPCQVFITRTEQVYVAELGYHAGHWPGSPTPTADAVGGRVSVFDLKGKLLARWGGGKSPCAPGDFFAPHGICVDTRGDVYVGEVTMSGGGYHGKVPADCHSLQKFTRD